MCGGDLKKATHVLAPGIGLGLDPAGFKDTWQGILGTRSPNNYASKLRAKIAREQWEDYKTRFQPIENILLDFANDPEKFKGPLRNQAMETINTQYGLNTAMADRRLGSYGLRMTDEQRNEFGRRNQLDQRLTEVQALNQIQRFGEEQLYNIVGGGTGRAGLNTERAG
jgi:hypothetical protein